MSLSTAFALIVTAFFLGAAFVAYQRDRAESKRYWEEHDRRRLADVENQKDSP